MKESSLGSKIIELRNHKGMTQKELADLCNVDIRTIQRIESGEVIPRMHTLKLLSKALDYDLINISERQNNEIPDKKFQNQLRLSLFASIIFSVNYIPVIFNIITNSFNEYVHWFIMGIHIISCVLLFKGFYHLGNQRKNQLIAIPALLAMVLLPLLSIAELLKEAYFGSLYIIFILSCLNAMVSGIGYLIEANKANHGHKTKAYKLAGITVLIQSAMFFSSNFDIVTIGLILSAFCNVVGTAILYLESQGPEKIFVNDTGHVLA